MAQWYKVLCSKGHQGSGKSLDNVSYVFGYDIVEALEKYKLLPSIKTRKTPTLTPLSPKEAIDLEKLIESEGIISVEQARQTGYVGGSRHLLR